MGSITNISLDAESSWIQASLPVREGGLGIWSAVQLAPSAFLASAAGSSDLAHEILPPHFQASPLPHWDAAISEWSSGHDHLPPTGNDSFLQHAWDAPRVSAVADNLLDSAPDAISRARLLATSTKESGAWLHALPISSLGLRMDDNTIRVAVGLRIGAPLGGPHLCHHCGADVDHLALHGLSCQQSQGRFHCHTALNDIVHRSLAAAQVPSRLEPTGIVNSAGKRPDRVTLVPWKCGRLLVWDVTCLDTYAPSYVASTAPPVRPELWQFWWRTRRIRSIPSLTQAILSCLWCVSHLGPWALRR